MNTFKYIFFVTVLCFFPLTISAEKPISLKKTAKKFFESLLDDNKKECLKYIVTHDQMKEITEKNIPKEEYQKKVQSWIDNQLMQMKKTKQKGKISFKEVSIEDIFILLPKNSKVKTKAIFAIIKFTFSFKNKEISTPPWFFFMQIDNKWKLSVGK